MVDKLFGKPFWLIQFLFHAYGVDEVAKARKGRERQYKRIEGPKFDTELLQLYALPHSRNARSIGIALLIDEHTTERAGPMNSSEMSSFIRSTANFICLPSSCCEFQDMILPFTVLHRMNYILEPAKDKALSTISPIEHYLFRGDSLLREIL